MEAAGSTLECQVAPMGAPRSTVVVARGCLHRTYGWVGRASPICRNPAPLSVAAEVIRYQRGTHKEILTPSCTAVSNQEEVLAYQDWEGGRPSITE